MPPNRGEDRTCHDRHRRPPVTIVLEVSPAAFARIRQAADDAEQTAEQWCAQALLSRIAEDQDTQEDGPCIGGD